jgi:hypothetical protein
MVIGSCGFLLPIFLSFSLLFSATKGWTGGEGAEGVAVMVGRGGGVRDGNANEGSTRVRSCGCEREGEKKRDKTGRIEVGLADDRVKKDG